jgi:poly(3-hydroxybutyrate) depolymerase
VGVTVGAVVAVGLTPLLLREGQGAGTCRPEVSEFRHGGRGSEVYTYRCGGAAGDREPADPPAGVLVHLHGDGAGEFSRGGDEGPAESTLAELAQVAASRDMVLIAPRTPDRSAGETWWRRLGTNVDWLTALVADRVGNGTGPGAANIWWSGYSGGAEMLSYGILRSAPEWVTGGAVMMAGGGAPDDMPVSAAGNPTVPLRWYVGDLDDGSRSVDGFDALSAAREGAAWCRRVGAGDVGLEVLTGVAHLDFPQADVLDRVLPSAGE